MNNTIRKDQMLFQLLPTNYLLQTYGVYTGEFVEQFLGSHADMALNNASWFSVVAMGGRDILELMVAYYANTGRRLDKEDAVFALFCYGDQKILGLQFGAGRHEIRLSQPLRLVPNRPLRLPDGGDARRNIRRNL